MDSLYDAFVSGLQSTKDNAQMDYDRVKAGGMPWGILSAIQQGMAMYGAPGGVPKVTAPPLKYTRFEEIPSIFGEGSSFRVPVETIKVPALTPALSVGKSASEGALGGRAQSIAEMFRDITPQVKREVIKY